MHSTLKRRFRRHKRIRSRLSGTGERPRFSVFRSNRGIFAQLIDDEAGKTLVALGEMWAKEETAKNKKASSVGRRRAIAEAFGELFAKRAIARGITKVVFDRGGYAYHGIVKAVADGARKGGLKF